MAANVVIPKLNPVKIYNTSVDMPQWYEGFQQKCYIQKYNASDVTAIQLVSYEKVFYDIEVFFIDRFGKKVKNIGYPYIVVSSPVWTNIAGVYALNIVLPFKGLEGEVQAKIKFKVDGFSYSYITAPILVKESHPQTTLIKYRNSKNHLDTIFTLSNTTIDYAIRVEGGFVPQSYNPNSEDEIYVNQTIDFDLLHSIPYTTFGFNVGNITGIPDVLHELINWAFSCDDLRLNDIKMVKTEGAEWQGNAEKNYSLRSWTIEVAYAENRNSYDANVDLSEVYWFNYYCQFQTLPLEYVFLFKENNDTTLTASLTSEAQAFDVPIISTEADADFLDITVNGLPSWLTITRKGNDFKISATDNNTASVRNADITFVQGVSGKTITLSVMQISAVKTIDIVVENILDPSLTVQVDLFGSAYDNLIGTYEYTGAGGINTVTLEDGQYVSRMSYTVSSGRQTPLDIVGAASSVQSAPNMYVNRSYEATVFRFTKEIHQINTADEDTITIKIEPPVVKDRTINLLYNNDSRLLSFTPVDGYTPIGSYIGVQCTIVLVTRDLSSNTDVVHRLYGRSFSLNGGSAGGMAWGYSVYGITNANTEVIGFEDVVGITPANDNMFNYHLYVDIPTANIRVNTKEATINPYDWQCQAFAEDIETGAPVQVMVLTNVLIDAKGERATNVPSADTKLETLTLNIPAGASSSSARKPYMGWDYKAAGAQNPRLQNAANNDSVHKWRLVNDVRVKPYDNYIKLLEMGVGSTNSRVFCVFTASRKIDCLQSGAPVALGFTFNIYCLYLNADRTIVEEAVKVKDSASGSIPYDAYSSSGEVGIDVPIDTGRPYVLVYENLQYGASGRTSDSSSYFAQRYQFGFKAVAQSIEQEPNRLVIEYGYTILSSSSTNVPKNDLNILFHLHLMYISKDTGAQVFLDIDVDSLQHFKGMPNGISTLVPFEIEMPDDFNEMEEVGLDMQVVDIHMMKPSAPYQFSEFRN